MSATPVGDVAVQSYFEARSNIRELEQRQFSTIQFFLGTFAAVMGGSIGLMQYVDAQDRPILAVAFVLLSNILSISLFFSWCSITLMINRVALFCLDLIDVNHRNLQDVFWETWLRSHRNKSSVPYLIESTLLVFLLPVVATFFLSSYFGGGRNVVASAVVSGVGVLILLLQYFWVLRQVKAAWSLNAVPRNESGA